MKTTLTLRDGFIEFEFGRVPLTDIAIDLSGYPGGFGIVRGDTAVKYLVHGMNEKNYGGCPKVCEVCLGKK